MQIGDLELFPVLIRQVEGFLDQTACAEILTRLHALEYGPHGALSGNAESSFDTGFRRGRHALDDIEDFMPIKKSLLTHVNTYARDFGIGPLALDNSWLNRQLRDSGLEFHMHSSSSVSGAIYLKVDDQSSVITFCNPNPFADLMQVHSWTRYTVKTVSVRPLLGSLLLFPSWLKHGSIDRNMSDERVVLSFNTTLHVPSRQNTEDR